MKDSNEVIEEFNELINMTATELEKWLKSDDSRSAGWPKEGGEGESVGHDSGRQIVEILKSNPKKDPGKYTDEQVQHMRKVVSYCKRHLAQEEKIDNEKSVEELKKTKSYASLKNWGHDILKKRGKTDDAAEDDGGEEEQEQEQEEDEKQAGDKRKAAGGQSGSKKKRETQKGESNGADKEEDEEAEDDEELEEVDEDDEGDEGDEQAEGSKSNGSKSGKQRNTRSKDTKNGGNKEEEAEAEEEDVGEANGDEGESKTAKGPKKGDTVSWNWGQGQPKGKVLDVEPEETTIETKNGNEVSRKGTEEDPAVVLDAGKSKAIKLSHELN